MSTSKDKQETKQSHLHFQMWDKYLNRLNTLWSVGTHERIPHSESVVPEPSSLKEKLLFALKKFILRTVQPVIDQLSLRQDHMLDAQKEFNAGVVQSLNGLVDLVDEDMKNVRKEVFDQFQIFQKNLDSFQKNLDSFQKNMDSSQKNMDSSQKNMDSFQKNMDSFQKNMDSFQKHFDALQSFIDDRMEQIEPRIDAFDSVIWTFDRRKEALEIDHILLNEKFNQLLDALRKERPENIEAKQPTLPERERQEDYKYFVFENLHRGDEREIKRRLEDYVQYYEDCSSVLDIGCARGEFLELLEDHQLKGYGIDINRTMIHYCQKKGLQAQEGDALSHLEALPDNSLDGIFVAHLVEHFKIEDLQRLLHLCFAKLQSHKYLILETPNPQSLYTLSHHFYKDLSHRNPLDPEAFLHLVNSAGFEEARIEPKNPFPKGMPHAKLLKELDVANVADESLRNQFDDLNQNIRQLNDIVYGYLDYAIVAPKVRKF
ncbi:MAG: methyltransferase domain-containing protein [bacterium]|nr:methyltransferase domain-containing protein [bacterium]